MYTIKPRQKIIIVGGGAGGLELATRLGRALGKKGKANITLIDEQAIHVWKPLLHEVAAGSLDSNIDQINYYAHASTHFYHYHPGRMVGLDRKNKQIILAPFLDEHGHEIIPARTLNYDKLIIAVGSEGNDFNIPGVAKYCLTLDNLEQANAFQRYFLNKILATTYEPNSPRHFNVVIVGAGATGIELAAELYQSLIHANSYGLAHTALKFAKITIIEASNRILAGLPEEIACAVSNKLSVLGINLITNETVMQVTGDGIETKNGQFIPADICIWAAGIKAPDFLANLDGLETDSANRLIVKPDLQTTRDPDIFAIGDCAHLEYQQTGLILPARAQVAHQEANFLAKKLANQKTSANFIHRDRGSIVTLATYGTYGSLNSVAKFKHYISGKIALYLYRALYFMHLVTLYGFWRALRFMHARHQLLKIRPRLKLHFSKH